MLSNARLLIDSLRFWPVPDAGALAERWSRADARAIVRLAAREGAALWLHRRLRALGVILPAECTDLLSVAARRSAAQSLKVDEEVVAAFSILDAAGIRAVPLKAAVMRRITNRVPFADARATADVDLLVSQDCAERAWKAFADRGYSAPRSAPKDGHHLAGLFGALGVAVELHTSTSAAILPAEAWKRATCDGAVAHFNGHVRGVPGDTELLWHAASHAMAHMEDAGRALRLRGWLDAAALLAGEVVIDWDRINARLDSAECAHPHVLRAWFRVASDLSGRPLPAGALGNASGKPIELERLLSWRLRVSARFPGGGRWAEKLAEEGARGEARLGLQPAHDGDGVVARARHAVACGAARGWWLVRRQDFPFTGVVFSR